MQREGGWGLKMAAKAIFCLLIPYSGWLYLQGAKFKYLRDKVHNINSLKLIQEKKDRELSYCCASS